MKKFKFVMPVMAFVMAVGMAFANKANVQTAGWINLNGVPTQLENDPCTGGGQLCNVTFANDPNQEIYPVFTDSSLSVRKPSGTGEPYVIME